MKEIRKLKTKKTKLLNKGCNSIEQFEKIQDELNEVELNIKYLEKEVR